MKSEKGITLTLLVVYIIVATIIISTMALVSTNFFNNIGQVKDQEKYAPEFNKFAMFFLEDVKSNKNATVTNNTVTFTDGNTYTYDAVERKIYRNDIVIAKEVELAEFALDYYTVKNTVKNIIKVNMTIGETIPFSREMEFVLRYW